jgi:hypothetical protein
VTSRECSTSWDIFYGNCARSEDHKAEVGTFRFSFAINLAASTLAPKAHRCETRGQVGIQCFLYTGSPALSASFTLNFWTFFWKWLLEFSGDSR